MKQTEKRKYASYIEVRMVNEGTTLQVVFSKPNCWGYIIDEIPLGNKMKIRKEELETILLFLAKNDQLGSASDTTNAVFGYLNGGYYRKQLKVKLSSEMDPVKISFIFFRVNKEDDRKLDLCLNQNGKIAVFKKVLQSNSKIDASLLQTANLMIYTEYVSKKEVTEVYVATILKHTEALPYFDKLQK